jgi:zinc-ribbon domain
MFCQQCGSSIRATARFCNMCGSEVRQRFSPQTEVIRASPNEPPKAGKNSNGSLSENSWPGAEETIIIPIVPGASLVEASSGAKKEAAPVKPAIAASALPKPKPQPPRPNLSVPKPFFTEVMPAIENRQHRRLVFVVPVLLIVFIILLVFAILVLPYIVAK